MPRPRVFHPENIQRRAEDLVGVGQEEAALQTIYDFLTSRRIRQAEPAELEPIAQLFVKLGTDQRNGKLVKDGLHQIKKTVQNSDGGLDALAKITKSFIELAQQRLGEAEEQAGAAAEKANEKTQAAAAAAQKVIAEEDFDVDEDDDEGHFTVSPEDILMSAVSTDDTTDRSNRALVAPWLRFAWESFRTVLDLLRNNSKLEVGYSAVANKAFQFCVDNNRKNEFRRLCEMIRSHLQSVSQNDKYPNPNPIDLSNPDTLQRYLEMRFNQLNAAVKLELWQEAFRSVEDVHTLMTLSKRQPKPSMLMSYYDDLSQIFSVSGDLLFHAAARQKYASLLAQSPIATQDERDRYASLQLISALVVPETIPGQDASDANNRKHRRLAALLSMSDPPTRESLLEQAVVPRNFHQADANLQQLYKLMETDFHPLSFARESKSVLAAVEANESYSSYLAPLRDVLINKTFHKVSQVYQTVKLDFLTKLCTYEGALALTPLEIEQKLLEAAGKNVVSISIDEDARVVTFESDPFSDSVENGASSTLAEKAGSLAQLSPAEFVRFQLSNLAKALSASVKLIDVKETENVESELKERSLSLANAEFAKEKSAINARYAILEDRKTKLAERKLEEAEKAKKAKIAQDAQRKKEAAQRAEEEATRRREEKIRREIAAAREKEKQKLIKEVNSNGIIQIDAEEAKDLDVNKLREMQLNKLAQDAKETEERMEALAKRNDYLERAERKYELTLLEKDSEDQQVLAKQEYDAMKTKRIEQARAQHEHDLKERDRLVRIVEDYQDYVTAIKEAESEAYAAAKAEAMKKYEEEKKVRIAEFIAKKRKEHEIAVARQREEEARQKMLAEEEAKRAEAEAERARKLEEMRQNADPERRLYNELIAKEKTGSLTFGEKSKLKRVRRKFEN